MDQIQQTGSAKVVNRLTIPIVVKPELLEFLGKPEGSMLSVREICAGIYDYAKSNGLKVGRTINLDAPLKKLLPNAGDTVEYAGLVKICKDAGLYRLPVVHKLLTAIGGHVKFHDHVYMYAEVVTYLDEKGELTAEDIDYLLKSMQKKRLNPIFTNVKQNFAKIMAFAAIIKKYDESAYDYFMTCLGQHLSGSQMVEEFSGIIDMLKFDHPIIAVFFDRWTVRYESKNRAEDCDGIRYTCINLAQYVLMCGFDAIYQIVKGRYSYTKDDVVYAMHNLLVGRSPFFKQFIVDQGIVGDEMICYTNKGQQIRVYEKIVKLIGASAAKRDYCDFAPRPTYPIIKMIPDVGRVTLLDKTHATVQSLTATGLVEKQMTYTITDGKIRLATDFMETSW